MGQASILQKGQEKESKVSLYNNAQGININLSGDNLIITSQHTGGVQCAVCSVHPDTVQESFMQFIELDLILLVEYRMEINFFTSFSPFH